MKNTTSLLGLALFVLLLAPSLVCAQCAHGDGGSIQDALDAFNFDTGNYMDIGDSYEMCIESPTDSVHFSIAYNNGAADNGSVYFQLEQRDAAGNSYYTTSTTMAFSNYDLWWVDAGETFAVTIVVTDSSTTNAFTLTVHDYDVPGGQDYVFHSNVGSSATLPVSYSAWEGEVHPKFNELYWATESEVDNSGFELQRSYDGERWSTFDFMPSEGQDGGGAAYLYEDWTSTYERTYYRLKQIDYDGTATYSPILSLGVESPSDIVLYPNPTSDRLRFRNYLPSDPDVLLQVTCLDAAGNVVLRERMTAHEYLSVAGLTAGTYALVIDDGVNSVSRRFVKQ